MIITSNHIIVRVCRVALSLAAACGSERSGALDAPADLPRPKVSAGSVGSEAKALAKQEGASFIAQFQFKKNSYELGPEALKRLRDLVSKASDEGRIDTVHLVVWADKEYPSSHRRQLAPEEVQLADRRAKAIADWLREHEIKANVEAYNMGERPNTFLSMLPTADTRIKKSLESEGIPTTAQDLSAPKYASKAVVLVLLAK